MTDKSPASFEGKIHLVLSRSASSIACTLLHTHLIMYFAQPHAKSCARGHIRRTVLYLQTAQNSMPQQYSLPMPLCQSGLRMRCSKKRQTHHVPVKSATKDVMHKICTGTEKDVHDIGTGSHTQSDAIGCCTYLLPQMLCTNATWVELC